jgi:hypothetical protein
LGKVLLWLAELSRRREEEEARMEKSEKNDEVKRILL